MTAGSTGTDWERGTWRNPPAAVSADESGLHVSAIQGSDAWRTTSYGFVHDSAHALLAPFPTDSAVEVSFRLDYTEQFDQAGVFLYVSEQTWIKAGVEISDGEPMVGAVVTHQVSDWSVAPVPEWRNRNVTVRVSRAGDAVTIRARVDDEPFRLVRVAPLDPSAEVSAGPFCCAPTRTGLTATFTRWVQDSADASLHPEPAG